MSKPGLLPRKAAWEVLQAVSSGAYADVALDRVVKKYSFKEIDRKLLTELSYGAIRQRKLLDCWINHLAKVEALKQPPLLRWLLHVGLYQILKMERIPFSAAVDTTVELAKNNKLSKLAPVVNAILRKTIRTLELGKGLPKPSTLVTQLAQRHSLPDWLVKELISWRGEQGAETFAKASNQLPSFDLRVNRRRTTLHDLQLEFQSAEILNLPIRECQYGLEVLTGLGDLTKWPGYEQGKWSVQDRSSQWIAPLLEAQPGERILDACAAPGSKTTHIAELINDQGEIWAVDRNLKRLNRVSQSARRLGLKSLNYLVADSSSLLDKKKEWKGYFQRILLDAPCSGLGTLARNPDARWRMSPAKIYDLVQLQEKLLEGVIPLLSVGGRLVYSTCTIHPKENSLQVNKFISITPGIKLTYEKQIWPDDSVKGDGFYAAVIDYV